MNDKYLELLEYIRRYNKVGVAFSGGVDSSLLLYAAKDALGENVIALTAVTNMYPKLEREIAQKFASELNVKHIDVNIDESEKEEIVRNKTDRCYYCKKHIFQNMIDEGKKESLDIIFDGTNLDDLKDYRPGLKALEELESKVVSPFKEVGMTKDEIRMISKELNLSTWNMPSMACLASRIPYGTRINKNNLKQVENCEKILKNCGYKGYRVRYHNEIARIELRKKDMINIIEDDEKSRKIIDGFKENGFIYITLDLDGYTMGSMNELI